MSVGLWLAVILVLLVLWLIYRRRNRHAPAEPADRRVSTSSSGRFHAVSIRAGSGACTAAKALSGERFLSAEAPPLPLPNCDAPRCDCRFQHHEDRRSGKDRRSPFTAGGVSAETGNYGIERRDGRERRRSDDRNVQ